MGKSRFRTKVGDIHSFLREAAGGDDFVEDAQKWLLGKGAVVFREQPFEDLSFPQRVPFRFVVLVFEFADFFGAEQPFFEKLQKLAVYGVDLLPDIGKESPSRSGKDKTSLLVSLLDRPGALNDALSILAARSINLTRIESRPVKDEPGRYLFFIDMLGHLEDEIVSDGCEKLKEICSYFEWLGSYPRVGE